MADKHESAGKMPALPAWRVFIAIEIPQAVRHAIKQHSDRLRAELPDVRASWTREDNLHLTLKFLGDAPVEKIEALSEGLQRAAKQVSAFELVVSGCGAFPPRGKPNVLWIGVSPGALGTQASCLQRLYEALEDECEKIGFARDTRPFHPHLTIARLRQPHGARRLADLHKEIGFASMNVNFKDVCLIRSELSSEGSRYTIIARRGLS